MMGQMTLRGIVLAILWVGLGVLSIEGKTNSELLWQAGLFSLLLILGGLIERVARYQGDPYILPTVQAITALGLVFLVRISPDTALRQFWWANLGLVAFYAVLWIIRDYRLLGRFQYLWGLSAISLLAVTLIFGVVAGGATSWLSIAGFRFEPEELVKIASLLFLAAYLGEHQEILRVGTVQVGRLSLPDWRTLGPFLIIAGISLGLLAAQKSLGTAMVFYSLFVLLLYAVTERWFYLGLSLPIFILTSIAGYALFGHVRVRVDVWLNPWQDPTGAAFQIAQSLFAIAGGGLIGTGLGNGIGAFSIPAASTDFIFAVIAEELGFAGAMAVLTLFLIIVLRALAISSQATDRFGQILSAGIGILIGVEALIILLGVTKLLPLTGIPLPWVSYGGTSLLIHFFLLGMLANISHQTATSSLNLAAKRREHAI